MDRKVLDFFVLNTKHEAEDVISIKEIHSGYTNNNFLIATKDKEFQVRFPIKIIDHSQEISALKTYGKHNVLFINKDGYMIKEWIIGRHPSFEDNHDLALIIDELKKIHQLKIPKNIEKIDWMEYFKFNTLNQERTNYFCKLAKKLEHFTPAFNHHDLNDLNILISPNNKECILIDFEWTRINSRYFDFASLGLNKQVDHNFLVEYADLDFSTLKFYEEIILLYSHMWCNYMNSGKSRKLQIKINKEIDKRF